MDIGYDGSDGVTMTLSLREFTFIREMLRELPAHMAAPEMHALVGYTPDEAYAFSDALWTAADNANIPF